MSNKPSISVLIEHLGCIREVDMMLREGASASDVARFIQDDQEQLPGVNQKTLTNALAARKRVLLESADDQEGFADVVYQDDSAVWDAADSGDIGEPATMGIVATFARAAYKRTKGGIKEHIEQEALYLAQRARIDELIGQERSSKVLMKQTGDEILKGSSILARLTQTKKAMGIIGTGASEDHIVGDFEGLSKETSAVLQNPESRHKVLSIVDRLAKRGQLKFKIDPPEDEAAAAD